MEHDSKLTQKYLRKTIFVERRITMSGNPTEGQPIYR
jgi:hypothetical protein